MIIVCADSCRNNQLENVCCVCLCAGPVTAAVYTCVFVYLTVAGHADGNLSAPEQLCNSVSIVVSEYLVSNPSDSVLLWSCQESYRCGISMRSPACGCLFLHEIVFGSVCVCTTGYYSEFIDTDTTDTAY